MKRELSEQVSDEVNKTYEGFTTYANSNGKGFFRRKSRIVKNFIRENPEQAETLAGYFPRVAGLVERASTFSKTSKVERVLREYEIAKEPSRIKRFLKRHPGVLTTVLGGLVVAQGSFSARAPNHPLMVDAYLFDQMADRVLPSDNLLSNDITKKRLEEFLISNEQIKGYTSDFLEDAKDSLSERAFVIVEKDGKLEQKELRTINAFLPLIPKSFLDRHHITRLDDEMELVAQGYKIVANGHYHVWGEPPSSGDELSGKISGRPEIVIGNGSVIYGVCIDGELIKPKLNLPINQQTFDSLNYIPLHFPINFERISYDLDKLKKSQINYAFVFLNNRYQIDPNDLDSLVKLIQQDYDKFFVNYSNQLNQKFSENEPTEDNVLKFVTSQYVFIPFINNPREDPNKHIFELQKKQMEDLTSQLK